MEPFDPYARLQQGITIALVHDQTLLDEAEIGTLIGNVYSLLVGLPKRIRRFSVRFSPGMSNVGGWHLTGTKGTIILPSHVVFFEVNDNERRNNLSFIVRPSDGHRCILSPTAQFRKQKFETIALPQMLIGLLRDLSYEETDLLPDDMTGALNSVNSFLKDPLIHHDR